MFFGICFSQFSQGEVICSVEGDTIEDMIAGFESEDIDFDDAFSDGRITIIEGDIVTLRQDTVYRVIGPFGEVMGE